MYISILCEDVCVWYVVCEGGGSDHMFGHHTCCQIPIDDTVIDKNGSRSKFCVITTWSLVEREKQTYFNHSLLLLSLWRAGVSSRAT